MDIFYITLKPFSYFVENKRLLIYNYDEYYQLPDYDKKLLDSMKFIIISTYDLGYTNNGTVLSTPSQSWLGNSTDINNQSIINLLKDSYNHFPIINYKTRLNHSIINDLVL